MGRFLVLLLNRVFYKNLIFWDLILIGNYIFGDSVCSLIQAGKFVRFIASNAVGPSIIQPFSKPACPVQGHHKPEACPVKHKVQHKICIWGKVNR